MNYSNKFKNREPLETVQIIKEFFQSIGMTLEEKSILQSASGTYSVNIIAYFQNKAIYASNGKGVTQEFALASGYAELYERLCNRPWYYSNFPLTVITGGLNKKSRNYYFHPNEKVYDFEEGLVNSPKFLDILNKTNTKDLFKLYCNNNWIGLPYNNLLNSNDVKYIDPRVFLILESSTGMAAGNTQKEAIIQGLSECFERQVKTNFIELIKNHKLYKLETKNIINHDLQEIIKNIQKEVDFYLFDASYYYNTPVLFGIIIDKINKTMTVNFSSFPVFDIAVERICTELYQGVTSYHTDKNNIIIPYRDQQVIQENFYESETINALFRISSIPEEFLLNKQMIKKEKPNSIFLSNNKEYSEQDIFDYYLKLCNQKNINVYYHDCSLSNKIYTIRLYIEEIYYTPKNYLKPIPPKVLEGLRDCHFIFEKLLFNYEIDDITIDNFTNNIFEIFSTNETIFNAFRGEWPYLLYESFQMNDFYNLLIELNNLNFYKNIPFVNSVQDPLLKEKFKEYVVKLRYLNSTFYSIEEIKIILSNFDIKLNEEDTLFYKDVRYLRKKIIWEPIYSLFHSTFFKEYLKFLISLS